MAVEEGKVGFLSDDFLPIWVFWGQKKIAFASEAAIIFKKFLIKITKR